MKNRNKGLLGWIILLIILVIFLIWLVIYKGFYADNNLPNENTITSSTTTTTEQKGNLSDEEIDKYLNYVPVSLVYDNAYEKEKVNINTINKAALLYTVYSNDDLKYTTSENNNYCPLDVGKCILEQDFNKLLEEMYNIEISFFDSEYSESDDWLNYEKCLILRDGYYFEAGGYGGYIYKSKISNLSYEISNNELIIKEQVGIMLESGGDVTIFNGGTSVKSYSFNGGNGTENPNYEQQAEEYVKDNIDDFNTYKHTFKQHDDGTGYYWYSTEVVES